MTDGARWLGQKNFTVKQLKNFGFGKKSLEGVMVEEAISMIEYIDSFNGNLTVDGTLFTVPVLNVLWNLVVGYSLNRHDKETKHICVLIIYYEYWRIKKLERVSHVIFGEQKRFNEG